MDKKLKAAILIIFFVFAAGITIDANNKINAIKSRKDSPVAKREMNTQQQNTREDMSEQNQQNTDVPVDSNGRPVEGVSPQMPYGQTQASNQENMTEERAEILGAKPPAVTDLTLTIPYLNMETKVKDIPDKFVAEDLTKNKYYFVARNNNAKMSEGTIGLLLKFSPSNKPLWQYEIKAINDLEYKFNRLSAIGSNLKLGITTPYNAQRTIDIANNGAIINNPMKPVFTPNITSSPTSYNLNTDYIFDSDDMKFMLISYADKKYTNSSGGYKQDFYLFRSEGSRLVLIKYLFTRNIPASRLFNLTVPEFRLSADEQSVIIMGTSEGDIVFSNVAKIPKEELKTARMITTQTSAPKSIIGGVLVSPANYPCELN